MSCMLPTCRVGAVLGSGDIMESKTGRASAFRAFHSRGKTQTVHESRNKYMTTAWATSFERETREHTSRGKWIVWVLG